MKVEVKEGERREQKYPYLAQYEGSSKVVMFTLPKSGVVLRNDSIHYVGEFRTDWEESEFFPFTGSVTLSN